jgi:hypothetical protein
VAGGPATVADAAGHRSRGPRPPGPPAIVARGKWTKYDVAWAGLVWAGLTGAWTALWLRLGLGLAYAGLARLGCAGWLAGLWCCAAVVFCEGAAGNVRVGGGATVVWAGRGA